MSKRFYFDHNACTPVDPRVLERFLATERDCPGNPGSLHAAGRKAQGVVEEARCAIADLIGIDPEMVFFVSGGTEANNAAISGAGTWELPVLTSAVEHPSTLAAAEQRGIVHWEVDPSGCAVITPPEQDVGLLALTHGQNETGALQPVEDAANLARELQLPLHIDASQTLGRVPLDEVFAMATSITFSTHKAGGLRGCGILVDREPATRPLMFGGGQQSGRRPGTESVGLVAATALAFELALAESEDRATNMDRARAAFLAALDLGSIDRITPESSLPNTVMLRFADVDGRELLPALDMAGVEASQGSACSSGTPTPPAVLLAMGLSEITARTCVRFSFGASTSEADAAEGARFVNRVVHGLRARH